MTHNKNKTEEIKSRKQKIQKKMDDLKQSLQQVIERGNKDFDTDIMQEVAKRNEKDKVDL